MGKSPRLLLVGLLCVASHAAAATPPLSAPPAVLAAPSIAVTIAIGPRGDATLHTSAVALLQRLASDGWFRLASAPLVDSTNCVAVRHGDREGCLAALRAAAATADLAPPVVFALAPARNHLAYVDCLGGAKYQEAASQQLLADYRLALSDRPGAESQRGRIASCLLSASRELAQERLRLAGSAPPVPACPAQALEGEWLAADGLAIRFVGPFSDPYSAVGEGRAELIRPGPRAARNGDVLYTRIRRMADCRFLATRHLWLDMRLHAQPPHLIELELSRETGSLTDHYEGPLVFRRLAGPLPLRGE